jgi:hypothetical protein
LRDAAANGSGVHLFTVVFDGESTDTDGESSLRFRVDTATERRARSITVNVESEDTLTVRDTASSSPGTGKHTSNPPFALDV